eukprot:TRINITY_DN4428_c0_g1_i1.p1 TRINITY_DN4428_c0_g1~~TRINITY_DN4428_c0_g1_i1.p1  ORF type:complete len:310 (-),score=68.01 TRINITY_DN4428_c0_g1_i1:11-940(-)
MSRLRIAIAGAGDVARYLAEECRKDGRYDLVILSREKREWFADRQFEIRITDYSETSLTTLLQDVDVLYSLIHDNTPFFNQVHTAMLEACKKSPRCKRFVPSEHGGDIEKFPDHPLFYVPTHGAIREILRNQSEIEYTLFNLGWFMDYFIPAQNSYMKRLPVVWPLDIDARKIKIPGSGDDPLSFTWARDVARAMLKLVEAPKWEEYIYVVGDTLTWHQAIKLVEELKGIKFEVTYRSLDEIRQSIKDHQNDANPKDLWLAYMDLWNALGASAMPEKAYHQRSKYFSGLHFSTVKELIESAEKNPDLVL